MTSATPSGSSCNGAMMDSDPALSVCSSRVKMFPRRVLHRWHGEIRAVLNSVITPTGIHRDFFIESPVAHPSVMLRRKELIVLGGYQERGWAEDYDCGLRYHTAGKRSPSATACSCAGGSPRQAHVHRQQILPREFPPRQSALPGQTAGG